jgi:hypothetical protein
MNSLIFVLAIALAIRQGDSFLSGDKVKTACNPNPCKNKAQCVLDNKDPAQYTCGCLTGYYGKNCENKDGCLKKPCKHGECIVNTNNRADFTCKCNDGYVGIKCDTKNACGINTCKNNGTCTRDKKNKPVCDCKPGFTSSNCGKRNCTIGLFKGKHFEKLPKLYIDKALLPKLKELDTLAEKCKVRIRPTRSFVQQTFTKELLGNAIYAPHYIGRALDFELLDQKGNLYCNSICLGSKLS